MSLKLPLFLQNHLNVHQHRHQHYKHRTATPRFALISVDKTTRPESIKRKQWLPYFRRCYVIAQLSGDYKNLMTF